MIRPGQEVNAAHAKVYPSKELFIGIQFPTTRVVEGAAAVRSNLDRVVHILNGVAANQPLPPIRVSFHTNAETRNRQYQYFRSRFAAYMGPLRHLRLPRRNPELKPSQVLTIDRLGNPKNDEREETCTLIERAGSQPSDVASALTYRQSMIDFRVEMATYNRFHRNWQPLPAYRPSTQRVAAAAKALAAFHTARSQSPPPWVTVALDQLPGGGVVLDENERRRRLGAIWKSLESTERHIFGETEHWVEGWSLLYPIWAEGRPRN